MSAIEFVDWLGHSGPLLALAIVITVGSASGGLARRFGLPAITGQIIVGVLVGRAGLGLLGEEALAGLQPLTDLALGLIAVTVGAHLNLSRLRNAGRRLGWLLLAEATIIPSFVFLALRFVGGASPSLAALFATTAIATAPATVVALVRETRSKGVFVKTLIAAVALNNMACIVLFELARTTAHTSTIDGIGPALGEALQQLLTAAAIGAVLAVAMEGAGRFARRADRLATAAMVSLVAGVGLSTALDVSPLLTCLVLGFVQTNITNARSQLVDSIFADFVPAILTVFFTLAGAHLVLDHIVLAGFSALLLFTSRASGKLLAANLAMRFAGATERVRRNLGMALIPQAGVAVGLVLLIQGDPAFSEVSGFFSAVVLSVVTVNEIVGPLLARSALARSGEIDRDRLRLIDFLQEEHIVTDFHAATKEQAIERMVDLMMRTHELRGVDRDALLASVLERESEASTCLGAGLSVPHGILPEGQSMVGTMAISRRGLDFETPDGLPVHCIVLLCTAREERDRHLQVLATLARTVGADAAFQAQLFDSRSAAHAYDLLHGEETEGFNYFLEDA